MSFRTRARLAITAMTASASILVMAPTEASTYSPGTAKAHIRYNSSTNSYDYYCSFANWRGGAKVTYSCNLYFREWILSVGWYEFLDIAHKGSWTPPPGSRTTSTWHMKRTIGGPQYCVKARALSVDGGAAHTYCQT